MQVSDALTGSINLPSAGLEVGDFQLISRVTLNIGQSSVTFGGIPQSFKHLQVRGIANNGENTGFNNQALRFNNDTEANYSVHYLAADGANASAGVQTSGTKINDIFRIQPSSTAYFGAFIVDILDYTSTTKAKTVRSLNGADSNGSGWMGLHSGLWYKTPEAITSMTFISSSGNFGANSSFALYGIRG